MSKSTGPLLILVLLAVLGVVAFKSMSNPTLITQIDLGPVTDSGDQSNPVVARLGFREDQGRAWSYAVVLYGPKAELSPGSGSLKIVANGKEIEIEPAEDAVWAIGSDLKPHRLAVKYREVAEIFDPKSGEEFLRSEAWLKKLKPELAKHKWSSK